MNIVITQHSQQAVDIDATSYFYADLPQQFALEHSPDWLSLTDNNHVVGTVPMVQHESQFLITIVGSTLDAVEKRYVLLNVVPGNLFDSMSGPLLQLNRVNNPLPPREQQADSTLAIMTYLFGYYHHQPHGQQFYDKLRNALNQRREQALPETAEVAELQEALQHEPAETQYELLEAAAEPLVFEEAQHHGAALHLHAHEATHAREHSVLEHVYTYWHAHDATALHKAIHEHLHVHPHPHLHADSDYELFEAMVKEDYPEAVKQLEESLQGRLLSKVKISDEKLEDTYAQQLAEAEEHTKEHLVYHWRYFADPQALKAPLDEMLVRIVTLLQDRQVNPIYSSYIHYYPC